VNGGEEIPAAVSIDEIAFALPKGEEAARAVVTDERDAATSRDRPEGGPVGSIAEDAVVVGDGAVRTESASPLAVQLLGVGHLGNQAHDNLGAQVEADPDVSISLLVESELAEGVGLPGGLTDSIGGVVGALQGGEEGGHVLGGGLKLQLDDQLHVASIANDSFHVKAWNGGAAVPPVR
jgi:hypothetical protein